MKKINPEQLLIGAHTSAAGGAYNALFIGKEIGATTVQLFTRNQKQWVGKPLNEEEIARFEDALEQTGLEQIMSHDSYLINLGSPKADILKKSLRAFRDELTRCQQLGISYLNFHPGAATGSSAEECLDQIVESLLSMQELVDEGNTRLLIETTAGQGTTVGHCFEEIGYLVKELHQKIPIGVCIDTCHIFAAGYDIRTAKAWNETLEEFDREIGLKHLYAFHLNDSMKPLGSKRDRHANLGEGEIGLDCFRFLMTDKRTRKLPKYLETPNGDTMWKKEIALLRKFASEKK